MRRPFLFKISLMLQIEDLMQEDPSISRIINNKDHWNLTESSHRLGSKSSRMLPNAIRMSCGSVSLLKSRSKRRFLNYSLNYSYQIHKPQISMSFIQQYRVYRAFHQNQSPFFGITQFRNQISSVRSLRKCHLPSLQYISIADNPVKDVECLSEMNNNLMRLDLQYQNSNTIGENLNFVCKMKTNLLKRIYIQGSDRIRNERISSMVMAKFIEIQIYEKQDA